MSKKYDLAAKTIVLGDGAVGKTSLIRRYVENKFEDTYNVTLGAEFLSKTVQIKKPEKVVKLAIWDLAGQAKYAEIDAFQKEIHRKILLQMAPEERKNALYYLELFRSAMEAVKQELV